MKIGYARVSTLDQDLGRQIQALTECGCEVIFKEKISGGIVKRPQLDKLLAQVKPGDTVVVIKIDRLGRSLRHLSDVVAQLKDQKVNFVSLGDHIDLSKPQGMLMFHMIGAFAEFEKALIQERVKDGMKFRKSQGQKMGRKFSVDYMKVFEYADKGWGATRIGLMMDCSRQTVHTLISRRKELEELELEKAN